MEQIASFVKVGHQQYKITIGVSMSCSFPRSEMGTFQPCLPMPVLKPVFFPKEKEKDNNETKKRTN